MCEKAYTPVACLCANESADGTCAARVRWQDDREADGEWRSFDADVRLVHARSQMPRVDRTGSKPVVTESTRQFCIPTSKPMHASACDQVSCRLHADRTAQAGGRSNLTAWRSQVDPELLMASSRLASAHTPARTGRGSGGSQSRAVRLRHRGEPGDHKA